MAWWCSNNQSSTFWERQPNKSNITTGWTENTCSSLADKTGSSGKTTLSLTHFQNIGKSYHHWRWNPKDTECSFSLSMNYGCPVLREFYPQHGNADERIILYPPGNQPIHVEKCQYGYSFILKVTGDTHPPVYGKRTYYYPIQNDVMKPERSGSVSVREAELKDVIIISFGRSVNEIWSYLVSRTVVARRFCLVRHDDCWLLKVFRMQCHPIGSWYQSKPYLKSTVLRYSAAYGMMAEGILLMGSLQIEVLR